MVPHNTVVVHSALASGAVELIIIKIIKIEEMVIDVEIMPSFSLLVIIS